MLSKALFDSPQALAWIEAAPDAAHPIVLAQIGEVLPSQFAHLPERVRAAPKVDWTLEGAAADAGESARQSGQAGAAPVEANGEAMRLLLSLLPPVDDEGRAAEAPAGAQRIAWSESLFSQALADALARHDHALAVSLVTSLRDQLGHRDTTYPQDRACADMQALRQAREFVLMRTVGEAMVAAGPTRDRLRRLYAQALIETGEHERAVEVLQSIITATDSSVDEIDEACGLMGRSYKQRYVDAPQEPGASDWMRRAIAAYAEVYDANPGRFWHGVNAASCMLRAERDSSVAAPLGRAHAIARAVVSDLDAVALRGPVEVWDRASRAEALLALDRYDEADAAVEQYLHHPAMTAFEASSTWRQFGQVLQIDRQDKGAVILNRLRGAVERYRAGSLPDSARPDVDPAESVNSTETTAATVPLVIRVANPAWAPSGVAGLSLQARMGIVITARGTEDSMRALLADPDVISVEKSRPAGTMECARSVPFIRVAAQYAAAAGPYAETGDQALVAIIDDGIDVLHGAFLDATGASRIVGIWDQNDTSGSPPPGFTMGTFHGAAAIAGYLASATVPVGLGRNEQGHGTHVASIAAGRAAGQFAGGVAPDARLLVVVSGGSGLIGYSLAHIEALAFIDATATAMKLPVVVNVSQGMNAGAHDGKSALEVAFDAFSESGRRRGRVVVKSAGNERAKGGHARVTMLAESSEDLRWRRNPGADDTERIELWWDSADEISFRLRDPAGQWSGVVATDTPDWAAGFANGGPCQIAFTRRHLDNGDSQLVIGVGSPAAPAALGEWQLELTSGAMPAGGDIHAWIERNQGVPSAFLNRVSEDMTLSIPATAVSVIAVGAIDAAQPIRTGEFSSYGPTRNDQKQPVVCAPGINVHAAEGGTAGGSFANSGTSMAAPHVAGAIALLLSRTAKQGGVPGRNVPGANQIASALRQKTQNYNGRWDRGRGFGPVDVAALLAAF